MSASHIDPDRLADAALGVAALSEAESAHVAGCAACRFEFELVGGAGRLGVAEMASLGSASVAKAVLDRLEATARQPRNRLLPRPSTWLAGLAVAAAVLLAVWYGLSRAPSAADPTESAAIELSVLHELDGLEEPELEDVLESMPVAAGAVSHVEPIPFDELNVNDLERVLRSMEE